MRRFVIAVASLAGLFALLAAVLHLPSTQRRIGAMAAGRLSQNLHADLQVDGLSFNGFSGHASAARVVFRNTPDQPILLDAEGLDLTVDLAALLRGTIVPENVSAKKASLHISRDAQGKWNFPETRAGGAPDLSILPNSLAIEKLSVTLEDRSSDFRLEAPEIALRMVPATSTGSRRFSITPSGSWRLHSGSTDWKVGVSPLQGETAKDSLAFDNFRLQLPIGVISGRGKLTRLEPLAYDFQLEADAPLAGLLPPAEHAAGQVAAKGHLQSTDTGWKIDGTVHGGSVAWQHFRFASVSGGAAYDSSTGVLQVFESRAAGANGHLSARGSLALHGPATATSIEASLDTPDAAALLGRFNLQTPLSSSASVRATFRFPGMEWQRAEAAGSLKFTPHAGSLPLQADAGMSLRGDHLTADIRSASLPGIVAAGRLDWQLRDGALEGRLAGDVTDLPRMLATFGVKPDIIPLTGVAHYDVSVAGSVDHPILEGSIDAREVSSGTIHNAAAQTSFRWDDHRLTLEEGHVEWAGQRASFRAGLDFHVSPPSLVLHSTGTGADLGVVLREAGVTVPLSGTSSFELDADGPLSAPNARLVLRGSGLVLAGQHLGDLQAQARLQANTLTVEPFQLSGLPAEGRATVDLDTRSYRFELKAPNWKLQPVERAEGQTLSATVSVNARGEGLLDAPVLQAELRTLDLSVGKTKIGEASAQLQIENGAAQFQLQAPSLALTARGSARLDSPYPAELSAIVDGLDISRFDFPATGRIKATVEARGDLSHPLDGTARVHVDELAAESGGEKFTSRGPVEAEISAGRLRLSPSTFNWKNATLQAEGELPVYASGSAGRLLIKGEIPFDALQPFLDRSGIVVQGSAVIEGGIDGSLEKPALAIKIQTGDVIATAAAANTSARFRLDADLTAASPDWDDLAVTATLPDFRLSVRDLEFQQKQPSKISLRESQLHFDQFTLAGPNTSLSVTGSTGILGDRALDLRLDGQLDAALLSSVRSGLVFSGPSEVAATLTGTWDAPRAEGSFTLKDGRMDLVTPPLEANNLQARIELKGDSLELTKLEGEVNGGRVQASGRLFKEKDRLGIDLSLDARNVYFDYPSGLKTVSTAKLTLKNEGDFFAIRGTVRILDGSYREAFTLASLRLSDSAASGPGDELLDRIRLDVAVNTAFPITMDNNLGRIEFSSKLRLVGNLRDPSVTGRLEIEPGGRIFALEREFRVQRARVDFVNESRIEPMLDIEASTRTGQYDVVLRSTGPLDNLVTSLSSRPQLTETQIESLLVTGSPDAATSGGSSVLSKQAASLFGTSLTGGISMKLRRWIGVSELRIEPGLISTESNPSARLTVGQTFNENFRIVYSSSLTESTDQIWFGEYDWRRKFLARVTRQSDNSIRGEFRQTLEFGGGSKTGTPTSAANRSRVRIGSVQLNGSLIFPEPDVRKELGVKPKAKYDFIKLQERMEKLQRFYAKKNYLEARVRMQRERADDTSFNLTFDITPGPPVQVVYEGFDFSGRARSRVALAWSQGIIDQQRSVQAVDALRRELYSKGYPDAQVTARIIEQGNGKRVTFDTEPGPRLGKPALLFEGVGSVDASALRIAIEQQRLDRTAGTDPQALRDFIAAYFRQRGFLAVTVDAPQLRRAEGKRPVIAVAVRPGAPFKVGAIVIEGEQEIAENRLQAALPLRPGDRYNPADRGLWMRALETEYWRDGFRDALIRTAVTSDLSSGTASLTFSITEGKRSVVAGISVEGNVKTSEEFIRNRIPLEAGAAADTAKMNQARKNLVDSLSYSLVDVTAEPATPQQTPAGLLGGAQPVWLSVKVREPKPYRFDFGAYYDTERGTGFVSDISRANLFGEARTLGLRLMIDKERQDARLYFDQPYLFRHKIQTTGAFDIANENLTDLLRVVSVEFSLQQTARLRNRRWLLNYGYRYTWDKFYGRGEQSNMTPIVASSAPLFITVSRDTRGDILDAWKGSFVSNAIEWGPAFLGGDYPFTKYYAQFFKYFGLTRPAPTPFSIEPRSRVVFATGARLGFIWSNTNRLYLPTDAFLAGGGTTIRGYPYNSLGAAPGSGDFTIPGIYIGGRSTLVINNEIRFPLYKFIDLAAFVDNGNAWYKTSDFSLKDLRSSTGLGFRVRNPFVVLRFDYGFILGRQPGEPRGGFYFSIGQIF